MVRSYPSNASNKLFHCNDVETQAASATHPRAVEIVNLVVNSVALGTHDNDAEIGAIAKQLGMTPARLETMLRELEAQRWLTVKKNFVYPTVAALRWQNPRLSEKAGEKILRSLK